MVLGEREFLLVAVKDFAHDGCFKREPILNVRDLVKDVLHLFACGEEFAPLAGRLDLERYEIAAVAVLGVHLYLIIVYL